MDEVRSVFEELGFTFKPGEKVFEQDQLIGLSRDGLTMVQLVGPADSLLTARVMVRLKPGMRKWELQTRRSYLEKLIDIAAPEWREGADWLAEKAPKLGRGGASSKTVGDVEFTVRAIKSPMILAVIVGDWSSASGIYYSNKSKTWSTGEKAKKPPPLGWTILIFIVSCFVIGVVIAIIDEIRKHKLHLDRFPLPSDEKLKAFSKMIPKEQRLQLPVEKITEEDLKAYKKDGFCVLEKKGRDCFLNWGVLPFEAEKVIPEQKYKYLENVIARHNWDHLQAMKEFSKAGTDTSILGKDETILTKLSKRFFEKDETILTTQDPVIIGDVNGILILTSHKILFDAAGYPGKRSHGIYFVTDYSRITSVETSSNPNLRLMLDAFPSYRITIGIGSDSYTFVTAKAVEQIKVKEIEKLIHERMGDKVYSVGNAFDDVGITNLFKSDNKES